MTKPSDTKFSLKMVPVSFLNVSLIYPTKVKLAVEVSLSLNHNLRHSVSLHLSPILSLNSLEVEDFPASDLRCMAQCLATSLRQEAQATRLL